jgi:hypothetical protein
VIDEWYLTWCPECERLWRVDLRTLLETDAPAAADAAATAARRMHSRSPVSS